MSVENWLKGIWKTEAMDAARRLDAGSGRPERADEVSVMGLKRSAIKSSRAGFFSGPAVDSQPVLRFRTHPEAEGFWDGH